MFDKRAYVGATLASVLAQRVSPREVIVVDDGSRDGGDVLVERLADPRVTVIRQPNAGPGAARNTGFAAARGTWVALIDADDLWREAHLSVLATVIAAHPDADMVGAGSLSFTGDPPTLRAAALACVDAFAPREIAFFDERAGAFHASSVAIRRTAFARTAGFADHDAGEDVEFWIRLALDHRIAVSAAPTALYRRRTGGIMDRAQANMARGVAAAPSPVFATLDAALRNPAYASRHAAIGAYADRTRIGYARSLIYHGQGPAARALLAGVRRRDRWWRTLIAASVLPGVVLRGAARVWSAAKRLGSRR